MGENAAIKQYQAKRAGQPVELFDSRLARTPVIDALLESPWVRRASEVVTEGSSEATKALDEPVRVVWEEDALRPYAFAREGAHAQPIDAIAQVWSSEYGWWSESGEAYVSRRFWRVISRGAVYDIVYDRRRGGWFLIGVMD